MSDPEKPPQLDRAAIYALLHSGNPGDVEHYERVCHGARTVLELGSGSGRIALRLAALGYEVTGLELDPEHLAAAQEKAAELPPDARARLTLLQGDMRGFDLGRTFDRILIPYNGLYCLEGIRGALECFEAARAHLAPEGQLWLDAYAVEAFHAEAPEDDAALPEDDEPVAELELGNQRVFAFERSQWDREEQRLAVTYLLQTADGKVVAEQHILHHYLLGTEVVLLLDEAGFEVTSLSGGFGGEPFDDDATTLVLGARLLGPEEASSENAEDSDDPGP